MQGRGVNKYKTDRLEVSVVALPHYPVITVRYRLHRLAVILALLNVYDEPPGRVSHSFRRLKTKTRSRAVCVVSCVVCRVVLCVVRHRNEYVPRPSHTVRIGFVDNKKPS
jgi:hypothetical protein